MKKTVTALTTLIISAAAALTLVGCGSIYNREYVEIKDYVNQNTSTDETETVTVKNIIELENYIRNMVSDGEESGLIRFSEEYSGDASEDMASACWKVRTTDALCAYCVDNISYELRSIVAENEAQLHITYSGASVPVEEVERLQYASEADDVLSRAIGEGKQRVAVLINMSTSTAEVMEAKADGIYLDNPALCPVEPTVNVNVYSGNNLQRLYEFRLNYGVNEETLDKMRQELESVRHFDEAVYELDDAGRALAAMEYLVSSCVFDTEGDSDSLYDALVTRRSDSRGLALTYKALCNDLNVDCALLTGRYGTNAHTWNIITIDGNSYHVDVGACITDGPETGFMQSDESMWSMYRWDVSAAPECHGPLTYYEAVSQSSQPVYTVTGEESGT